MPESRLAPHRDLIIERLRAGRGTRSISNELGCPDTTLRDFITRENLRVEAALDPRRTPAAGAITQEEILREEVRQLRNAVSARRRSDVATERIIAAVERAADSVDYTVSFTPPPQVEPAGSAHHRHVVLWSDWHGGENVDPETVNGLNDYDWSIMEQRVDEMLDGLEKHRRRSPALTGIDILIPGDQCSGNNHEELARTNVYPLAEQAIRMGRLQARAIEHLAPNYEEVRVATCVGNHPRLVKAPAAKDTHDNMDWVAAMFTKEIVGNLPNVSSFVVGRTSFIHRVAGRNCYVFHGDGIRTSMPGVPWGGVMRRVNEIGRQFEFRVHHYFLGHFHDPNVVQGGRVVMNGSLKGVDEWVQKNFGGGSPPTQILLNFDEKAERLAGVGYLTPTAGL